MKSLLILCFTCFFIHLAPAQQWVDQQYRYDSLLNISYGTAVNFVGNVDTLHMDVYMPICEDSLPASPRPLMMWIHGGAFLAGDKNDASIQAMCKSFARRGYVTASIDYRLGFVSDERQWQCNYPNYNCIYATDSAEWSRAYYRAVQDAKGALRYLINRYQRYHIDTSNIFLAGESAGAFTALGVGLMDTLTERPPHTDSISDVPVPNVNSSSCVHNQGIIFSGNTVSRPDLGDIEGDIEPSNIQYAIKGIGNMYGAMMHDLLKEIPQNKPKPAIYSFHQPCDIIVPIDSNYVYWGLSWCFTNGYDCFGVTNNQVMLYGSRAFSNWNTINNYGYDIQNEFTTVNFPYNFLFGAGSCADQVNNPCHAYDNRSLREQSLAEFFAEKVASSVVCDSTRLTSVEEEALEAWTIYPNPVKNILHIKLKGPIAEMSVNVFSVSGSVITLPSVLENGEAQLDMTPLNSGLYIIQVMRKGGVPVYVKVVKE